MMQIDFENYSISPIQEKDAWRLCDLMVSNSERFKSYFPQTLQQNLTPTLAELFVGKKVKEFMRNEEFLFTIKENTNRSIIGLLYVKELKKTEGQGELAYCISYRFEGRGIIKTSVEKIIPWCFRELKLQTLQIIVHHNNLPSKLIAEKNGFVWKRTLPNVHTTGSGEILDMELYELHNPKAIT
ncbi:Ribosomal-protein-alanine N-acetyltransferase [Flagellimonas maritima]|uniref:Ribosomal-protein-alanine N-acetyltransferase n=1 Tax=Flagellimonas maritima TaxID=1383885 RepID=A0A2Z4LSJ0_9FLAO|nr:GNAT family protein [Allomuricauda aurantiaca]AWX44660.1 Ribosomal-protein-alanine N-acetyltransferase [Allomuricauda aurantiaca]